jgi:hypothetical protein
MTVAVSNEHTQEWAQEITLQIHESIVAARVSVAHVEDLLLEAQEGQAWELLGFRSWPEYVSDIFAQTPLRLAREDRIEAAKTLTKYGMSTRAIAPILGVDDSTVARDLQGTDAADTATIVGMDGKTYQKSANSRPDVEDAAGEAVSSRRPRLATEAREAARAISAGLDLIENIMADKRYQSQKEKVRAELATAIERCDSVFGDLESEVEDESEGA